MQGVDMHFRSKIGKHVSKVFYTLEKGPESVSIQTKKSPSTMEGDW